MTTMAELPGNAGFAPPRTVKTLSKRRAVAIELMATVALTASLIVAATAVSIGGNRSLGRGEVFDLPSAQTPTTTPAPRARSW
jgi:hypothetical protein